MKVVGRKIIVFFVLFLFLGVSTISGDMIKNNSNNDIFDEINSTEDKLLTFDSTIGNLYVKYWEHIIDGIAIKNDYILLHLDDSNQIIKYDKQWEEVETPDYEDIEVSEDIFWKKAVIFPNEYDTTYFYYLNEEQVFPLFCWEVRNKQGETTLYDINGEEIGYGIPTPFLGFSMSGFHEPSYPDPWLNWRLSADSWYSRWCSSTVSMSFPTPAMISSYISDPEYNVFYEIAHGGSTYFQATQYEFYYASDVTAAMQGRDPMRFTFIGSCGGMDITGPGTWSYEFRKGETVDTVCVGYTGMASCPGWSVSLPWQDHMFYAMDVGYTIKEAFDLACAEYPTIADCVVFTGDINLKIREEEEEEDPPEQNEPPHVRITYPGRNDEIKGEITITGIAWDVDGQIKLVYIQIDGGDYELAEGTDTWSYEWDTTKVEDGEHIISAIAYDGSTYTCHSIEVIVKNEEEDPPEKIPNLDAEGDLSWSNIKPGIIVYRDFMIENIGDEESLLNWEISESPDWGEWDFNPSSGNDLTPEMGKITVQVAVDVPEEKEQTFSGSVKIINKDNSSDYEIIDVTMTTSSKSRVVNQLLGQIIEKYPQLFKLIIHFFSNSKL